MAKPRAGNKSGHGPTYDRDPKSGLVRSTLKCACHGQAFETRKILSLHVKLYHKRIVDDFEVLVKTGGLGQEAWERLPGETPLQYARFQIYLTKTTDARTGMRSTYRVAAIIQRSEKLVRMDAIRYHWKLRADLFDRHIERGEFESFEKEKRESARRQARLGQKLQEVARAGAVSLLSSEARVAEMSGNEIAKLADVGTKIERLANQDPTAISEDRGQVKIVWEGPRPSWAPAHEPPTLEGQVRGGEGGEAGGGDGS